MVFAFAPPAVLELGNATGFDFELMDEANAGHDKLMAARNQLLGVAAKDPRLIAVRPNGLNDEPQYRIAIDREKASALGLTIADINNTLSAAWGSALRQRFHRPRAGQAGVHPGRRQLPHAARSGSRRLVRAQQPRPDGAVLVVRHRPLDLRLAQAGALRRRSRRSRSWARRRPGQSTGTAMAAMEELRQQAAARFRLRMDRPVLRGEAVRLADRRCSTADR